MSVLKIIGIVLLVILAVILILLLLVLFVPIFYRLDAHVPETDPHEDFDVQKVDVSVRFSWLLFVIRGGISFPKDKEFTLRVFGIKILPKKEKAGASKEEDTITERKQEKEVKEEKSENTSDNKENTIGKEQSGDGESVNDTSGDTQAQEDDTDDKSFLDVIWNIIDTIQNILETPLNVFEKIQYTISRVYGKIDMIKSTLENDIFKRAFELVRKKLLRLIRMILPDRCKIDAVFGTGDPALTAEVYGGYAIIRAFLSRKIKINCTPDFDRCVVYTDTHMRGHITLFTALYITARCYFDKDIKKTIKRFKKIINS